MIRFVTRFLCLAAFAGVLLLAPGGTTLAGDGGTVEVATLPAAPLAGQALRIAFAVRTHGRPIDYFVTAPIRPYLTATNRATGESLRADGYKDGGAGAFAVDVTFPSPGEWSLLIKAEPLMLGAWTGHLAVAPPTAGSAAQDESIPATIRRWSPPVLLGVIGLGLLLARQWQTRRVNRETSPAAQRTA